ncbi:MAG: LysM peptidoglycan-binding domain-containing protein [Planctomycetes bacterium]|nr:LysM peptidoglycan-binding domain-containing protein [Planctomycetota bacterium]
MAQPEAPERSPRVRKDAKIALIVILALMVLVVVIWGRSPRPDDQAAAVKPVTEAPKDPAAADATARVKTDPAPSGSGLARHDVTDTSPFPSEGGMINSSRPADRGSVRHDAAFPGDARADAGTTTPAPTDRTSPGPSHDATQPAPKPALSHTVAKGDTLMKLAVKYYKDQSKWRIIQQANRGVSVLQVGQKLTIPPLPDAPAGTSTVAPTGTTPAPSAPADRPAPDRSPRPAPTAPTPASGKTYTVQKGDTFMKIARSVYRDPAKWRTLYDRNRAKLPDPAKPDSLRPGTVIELPALASAR